MKSLRSVTWLIACFASVAAPILSPCAAGAVGRIEFDVQPDHVLVRVDERDLATYVHRDSRIPRPYFKDLYAPGGIQVTRNHPPREGVDPTDHAEYHPGLWLAFGDLGGADFWRNKAAVRHVEFIKPPVSDERKGHFTVRNAYMQRDVRVCEEVCRYTFLVRAAGILILWDSLFMSAETSFYFGDQEEMGLGLRMATAIAVKSGQGGRILDSEGRRNEKETWGKTAAWCDYSGWVDKTFVGVSIMPHPDNVRPCWWHTRDYGFMTANPFGRAAFRAGPTSKLTVRKTEPFHLSYGILIHASESEQDVDLAAAYRDYLDVLRQMRTETSEGGQR